MKGHAEPTSEGLSLITHHADVPECYTSVVPLLQPAIEAVRDSNDHRYPAILCTGVC